MTVRGAGPRPGDAAIPAELESIFGRRLRRVLQVNKFFYGRGGAENYMFRVADLLESQGVETLYFATRHPENRRTPTETFFPSEADFGAPPGGLARARIAGRTLYSLEARRAMSRLLERHEVDLAHVHNIYHHFSPSILAPLRRRGVPVVMTVHDYKLVCPIYVLRTHGEICERCVGGHFHHAVRLRCERGSLAGSALVATETWLHRRLRLYERGVDVFVTPSRYLRDKLVEGGYPPERIRWIPNYVDASAFVPEFTPGPYFAYVGRLSHEKGLETLIEAVAGTSLRLKVLGDGPLRAGLESRAREVGAAVEFSGHVESNTLAGLVRGACAVVLPSEWPENGPLAVLEAMAWGKPVVASRVGGIPEFVREGREGLLVPHADPRALRHALERLARAPEEAERLGRNARARVEESYTPEAHLGSLAEAYAAAIAHRDGTPV